MAKKSPTTKPTNEKTGNKQGDKDKRRKRTPAEEKADTRKEVLAKIEEARLDIEAGSFIEKINIDNQLFGDGDLKEVTKWVNEMNNKYDSSPSKKEKRATQDKGKTN